MDWFDEGEPEYEQRPTPAEECDMRGHPYYGDPYPDAPDGRGGSCYCGRQTYPTGGMPDPAELLALGRDPE